MKLLENKDEYYDKEVLDKYPYIIAHEYKRLIDLLDKNQLYGACLQIKDVYEVLLKFPILLVLADINRKQEKEYALMLDILSKSLSMGNWLEKAHEIIKNGLCDDTEIYEVLFDIKTIMTNNNVVKWRNDNIGHGALALENNESFKKDIRKHLEVIKEYIIKFKDIYPNIKLYVNEKSNQHNYLMGNTKIDKIDLINDRDIYIETSMNEYTLYPFIEVLKNEIYFFDSFILKNKKTALLNYITGDKLSIKNNEFINIYNICNNVYKTNKLNSNINDSLYLESELEILDQMEKLNGFEEPKYIYDWVQSVLENESNKKGIILLQAERGMGKSSFVNSIDQLSLNKKKAFDSYEMCIRAYYVNDTYGASINNFEREVNEIFTYNIGKSDKIKAVKVFELNSKEDLAKLLNAYRLIQERHYCKERLLFVIDGIDENTKNDGINILDLIPSDNMLDDGVFILLTCRTDEEVKNNKVLLNRLSKINFIDKCSFYRQNNDKYIGVLKQYIKNQVQDKTRNNDTYLSIILKCSDYRFLYLKTICQVINSKNESINLENIAASDFIESYLEMLKYQYSEKFFNKLLNVFVVIVISYNPIGIKQICSILGENSSTLEIIPILYDLQGFLIAERSNDGNVYSITNEEIKEAIINKFSYNIHSIIKNLFNDLLEVDFNSEYNEKSVEVIFFKNIQYYMEIAEINEESYVNISFIEKVSNLIRNFKIDFNSYNSIEVFIELCSEMINLIVKLKNRLNKLNEEKVFINDRHLIDIYLLRAIAYSHIDKQNYALEDFIIVERFLNEIGELSKQQELQLANCYSEMGKIYRYININKSIESYDKALRIYGELSMKNKEYREDYLGNILNKANTYLRIEPDKALELYDLFIKEYQDYIDSDEKFEKLSFAYGGKARSYRRIDNGNEALKNIQLSMDYYNKINSKVRDEYLLVKLYVNRSSIYLNFYYKNKIYLNEVIKDSDESINIINRLLEDNRIIEKNVLINSYFNKALALFYNNELKESLDVFIDLEKLIVESLEVGEYVNYDIVIFTYKYLILLDKCKVIYYYRNLIDFLNIVNEMDSNSVNLILEELYYIVLGLIEKNEFNIIIKLSYLTEKFIRCNIDSSRSYKIREDIVAIYTLIAIAYDKVNDKVNFEYFSNLAVKYNLNLYILLFNEYS